MILGSLIYSETPSFTLNCKNVKAGDVTIQKCNWNIFHKDQWFVHLHDVQVLVLGELRHPVFHFELFRYMEVGDVTLQIVCYRENMGLCHLAKNLLWTFGSKWESKGGSSYLGGGQLGRPTSSHLPGKSSIGSRPTSWDLSKYTQILSYLGVKDCIGLFHTGTVS